MMNIKKLENHPYAQCHVELDPFSDSIKLVSYGWYVAVGVDSCGWMSCRDPHYSATTAKQVGWFLKEYFPQLSYHDIKKFYEDQVEYNIYSGEVRPY